MEVVNLIGESLFLDYLIATTQNFTYENDYIQATYNSHVDVADVEAKIAQYQSTYDQLVVDQDNPDTEQLNTLQRAIQILTDLKNKLS